MQPANPLSDKPTSTIGLIAEGLIDLKQAASFLADSRGRKPCIASLRRWAQRGCRGNKLDVMFVGNRMLTSRQAVARFLSVINGGPVAAQELPSAANVAGRELAELLG